MGSVERAAPSIPASCVDPEAFAAGLLTDRFDAVALNYAAFDDDGRVIGSIRVVPDGPLGLPLESGWPLDGFRHGKRLAELCRLAVSADRRMTRLPLLLMKAGWQGVTGTPGVCTRRRAVVLDCVRERAPRSGGRAAMISERQ